MQKKKRSTQPAIVRKLHTIFSMYDTDMFDEYIKIMDWKEVIKIVRETAQSVHSAKSQD